MPMIYKINNIKIIFLFSFLIFFSCSDKSKKVEGKNDIGHEKIIDLDSTLLREGISLKHPSEFDSTLVYTVQIGAFKNRNSAIEESSEVQLVEERDSLIKYRFGNYRTYNDASTFKQTVQQLYPDAFIVPINKGQRIDISQALELSNEAIKK